MAIDFTYVVQLDDLSQELLFSNHLLDLFLKASHILIQFLPPSSLKTIFMTPFSKVKI